MFGHLKPQDFVNWMEGGEAPASHKTHLDSCARCRGIWESLKPLHDEVASLDTEIPEPDWTQFRSSVRDELLSRSIQRQSAVWPWTGRTARSAFLCALSILLTVGIHTHSSIFHFHQNNIASTQEKKALSSPT